MTAKIPSPTYNVTKSKPEIHSTLKVTKSVSVTKETDANKDTLNLQAKKETASENETELEKQEVPEEKPVEAAEVEKPEEPQKVAEAPKKEVPPAPLHPSPDTSKVEKKEIVEKESITVLPPPEKSHEKPIDIAKLKMKEATEKKSEPERKEASQEKVAPKNEVKETAIPQQFEEPLKEIPVGEKPDTKETQRSEPEKKPSTEEGSSSHEVKKAAESQKSKTETASKTESSTEQNKTVSKTSEKALSETKTKGKPKASERKKLQAGLDKKLVSSEKSSKGGAAHTKGGNSTSGQLPSQEGSRSSRESNSPAHDEGKGQTVADSGQQLKGKSSTEINQPGPGIPVSEALIPVDLKIEVFLRKPSSLHPDPQTPKVPASPATKQSTTKQNNMPKATEITQVSLETFSDEIKVRIKGNGSLTPKVFPYQNRIVIDIPRVVMNAELPSQVVSPLKEIRSGKHKDKSRLVLELNEKMPFNVSSSGDTAIVTVLKSENKTSAPPVEQKMQEITETKALKETDISNISMRLLKNAHPMANRKEKQIEVSLLEGKREAHSGDASAVKKTLSVLRTAEGTYTFILTNQESETYGSDLAFFIFPGKKGERTKKFSAVALSPNAPVRFKFILPEAIFWDDEDYFSGKIENGDTLTKFSGKTGLVWKEIKDE